MSNSEHVFTGLISIVDKDVSNLILGSESMAGATQSYVGATRAHENIFRDRIEVYRDYIELVSSSGLRHATILESGAGPVTPSPEENLWFHAHVHNVCNTLHQSNVYVHIRLMTHRLMWRNIIMAAVSNLVDFSVAEEYQMADDMAELESSLSEDEVEEMDEEDWFNLYLPVRSL